jgi:hypothetical protein
MITTFGISERTRGPVTVATGSHLATAGWTSVLRVPAARWVAGHTYLIVLSGMIGDTDAGKTDPTLALRAELSFLEGGGSYWGNVELKLDPTIPALVPSAGPFAEVSPLGRGVPFFAAVPYTVPGTALDLEVIARFAWPAGKVRGVDFQAISFRLDQVALLAFDLTVAGSSPLTQYFRQAYVAPSPSAGAALGGIPPAALVTQTGIPGGAWLVLWSALIAPRSSNSSLGPIGRLWTNISGLPFLKAAEPIVHFGQAPRPDPATDRYWMGQIGIIGAGSTWAAELQVGDDSPTPGLIYRAELLILDVGTAMSPLVHAAAPSGGSGIFFDAPFQGDYDFHRQTFAHAYARRRQVWFYHGRASAQVGCATVLEVDSGPLGAPQIGAIATRTRTASRTLYCGVPQAFGADVEIGLGTHAFMLRGLVPPRDEALVPAQAENLDTRDLELLSFCLEHDSDPPAETVETPGPPIAVVPMRETALDPGSLPSLPVEPSLAVQLTMDPEIRSITYTRGYRTTSPRYIRARRAFQLSWRGLEVDAADDLLEDLEDASKAALGWTAPGDLERRAWAIYPPQISREGSDALACTLIELVFVAEPTP